MPTYNVLVRDVSYKNYPVLAGSEEEAVQKVQEGENDVFHLVDGGEWEIVSIDKAQD